MEKPRVIKVLDTTGPDHAVVFVRGWLSKHSDDEEKQKLWADAIRRAGWSGAVYHLWWDAKSKRGRRANTASGSVRGAAAGARGGVPGAVIGMAVGGIIGFDGNFRAARDRAKRTGKEHTAAQLATEVSESRISLIGHSLGARVIYSLLTKGGGDALPVVDTVLLGGAIRRDSSHDWEGAADAISGNLVNLHSKNDSALKKLTRRRGGQSPCGRKPIKNKGKHPRIINVDVSREVHEHDGLAYLAQVPRVAHLLTLR